MGLGRKKSDPVFQCHRHFYQEVASQADILLLENVPEYNLKEIVREELGDSYECVCQKIDPRVYGMGCARPRFYGIAWRRGEYRWNTSFPFEMILDALKARPRMFAMDYWYLDIQPSRLTDSEDI